LPIGWNHASYRMGYATTDPHRTPGGRGKLHPVESTDSRWCFGETPGGGSTEDAREIRAAPNDRSRKRCVDSDISGQTGPECLSGRRGTLWMLGRLRDPQSGPCGAARRTAWVERMPVRCPPAARPRILTRGDSPCHSPRVASWDTFTASRTLQSASPAGSRRGRHAERTPKVGCDRPARIVRESCSRITRLSTSPPYLPHPGAWPGPSPFPESR
jgi:hypothetical protein